MLWDTIDVSGCMTGADSILISTAFLLDIKASNKIINRLTRPLKYFGYHVTGERYDKELFKGRMESVRPGGRDAGDVWHCLSVAAGAETIMRAG